MKAKHTPGPWHIYPDYAESYIESGTGYEVCQVMTNHPKNADTQAANARLIAAAPELLDALQAALDDYAGIDINLNWQETARAAIAKATGAHND